MIQAGWGFAAAGLGGISLQVAIAQHIRPESAPFLPLLSVCLVIVGVGMSICGEIRKAAGR